MTPAMTRSGIRMISLAILSRHSSAIPIRPIPVSIVKCTGTGGPCPSAEYAAASRRLDIPGTNPPATIAGLAGSAGPRMNMP